MLANVDRLVRAYYEDRPDPTAPSELVVFGTSRHPGSWLARPFNEPHILAIDGHPRDRATDE